MAALIAVWSEQKGQDYDNQPMKAITQPIGENNGFAEKSSESGLSFIMVYCHFLTGNFLAIPNLFNGL
ncbi:hypothetical protein CBW57_09075 [Yersinia intermedia]|uniref:Uncharacterized protein n=1 Tax=Yersinia intermedia TaxID=631 RepID=A0A209A4X6_YERIN|nr:hypothetical protein CBW57_09075 [Yersinia intermedia]